MRDYDLIRSKIHLRCQYWLIQSRSDWIIELLFSEIPEMGRSVVNPYCPIIPTLCQTLGIDNLPLFSDNRYEQSAIVLVNLTIVSRH